MSREESAEKGLVSISIDLELGLRGQTTVRQARLESLTKELVGLFESHHVPATWAVADPAHSAAREAVLSSSARHELAVLGDGDWIGNGNVPSRLDRELSRRFEGARRTGLAVSTLTLRGSGERVNLGLLLAHRVTALRSHAHTEPRAWHSEGNSPARFGVWQAAPALQLPLPVSWWQPTRWAIRGEFRETFVTGKPLYVALDADRLVEMRDLGLNQVDALLRQVTDLRTQGAIDIGTLAEIAQQNLGGRSATPSRSVLRPAA